MPKELSEEEMAQREFFVGLQKGEILKRVFQPDFDEAARKAIELRRYTLAAVEPLGIHARRQQFRQVRLGETAIAGITTKPTPITSKELEIIERNTTIMAGRIAGALGTVGY